MMDKMRRYILALLLFCIPVAAYAITTNFNITVTISSLTSVFNCSGFASSGTCGVSLIGGGGQPFAIAGSPGASSPGLVGSQVNLIPANAVHTGLNLNYLGHVVNVGQFSTTFTYVPNGWNIALTLSNNTNSGAGNPASIGFTAGAGCEGSFFQGFTGGAGPPNNTFALQLDQWSNLVAQPGGGTPNFTYSSAQYYDTGHFAANNPLPPGQSPCNPDLGGSDSSWTYAAVTKVTTSPVALNSPAGTLNTTTGHTYSVTISYDGSNLTISMFDVTAGGACPGAACFTNTWTGVNIPAIVGGPTAYVGLAAGTNASVPNPLLINTFSYSSN